MKFPGWEGKSPNFPGNLADKPYSLDGGSRRLGPFCSRGSVSSIRVRSERYVGGASVDSPRISRDNEADLRTLVAAKDGPFYMYIAKSIQISQYRVSDILNRGQFLPGDGGAMGNRRQ